MKGTATVWNRVMRNYVIEALLKDPEKEYITFIEILAHCFEAGMEKDWRNVQWVRKNFFKIRLDNAVVYSITATGEYVGRYRGRRKPEAITIYGRIPEADETYDEWESRWWSQGRRGGVVAFHRKLIVVKERLAFAEYVREHGYMTEDNIQRYLLEPIAV